MKLYAPSSSGFFLSTHLKILLSIISLLSWIGFMQSLSDLLMLGIVIACGSLVAGMNNFYNILEKRNALPFLVVWWISGAVTEMHTFQHESISLLTYTLVLLCLVDCWSVEKAPVAIFNMCAVLGLGTAFFPPMLFLLPLSLLGLAKMSPVTSRKFLASLIGFIVPFWFILAYTLLKDDCSFFMNFASQIRQIRFFDYSSVPMEQTVTFITITLWLSIFIVCHVMYVHSFQLRNRLVFTCFSVCFIYVAALSAILPQYLHEFLWMEIMTGVLFAAYFVTHGEIVSPRLAMIINTVVFFIVLTVNVWRNLSIPGAIWD